MKKLLLFIPFTALKIWLSDKNNDDNRIASDTMQQMTSYLATLSFILKETPIYTSLLLIIIFLFFCSCGGRPSVNSALVEADSLMENRPDSALSVLESVDTGTLETEEQRAYYALLLTQAKDKNFIWHTDDSLISTAVAFYDREGTVREKALSHFYRGCVLRDMNEAAESVKELLTAEAYAEEACEKRLAGLANNNLGYIYYVHDFFALSDTAYQRMGRTALEIGDSCMYAEALLQQGNICIYRGETFYGMAKELLEKSLSIADANGYTVLFGDIYLSLGRLYIFMKDRENSLKYTKLSLAYAPIPQQNHLKYLLLARAYFLRGENDSAKIFIGKCMETIDNGIKSEACMLLGNIAEAEGDTDLSFQMERRRSEYHDSMDLVNPNVDLAVALTEFHKEKEKHQLKSRTYIFVGISLFVILFLLLGIYLNRRAVVKKAKELESSISEQKHLYMKKLADKKNDIMQLQEKLYEYEHKSRGVVTLQSEIDNLTEQRNMLTKEILGKSDVQLKMRNIVKGHKRHEESAYMTEEDWRAFVSEMDSIYRCISSRLEERYALNTDEIRICCLFLSGFKPKEIQALLGFPHSTFYRKKNEMYKKIVGQNAGNWSIEEILTNIKTEEVSS